MRVYVYTSLCDISAAKGRWCRFAPATPCAGGWAGAMSEWTQVLNRMGTRFSKMLS